MICEILTEQDTILRMVAEQFFPTQESAEQFINIRLQKQADYEAQHMYNSIKEDPKALAEFKAYGEQDLVVKNFAIIPVSSVIQITNNNVY
jgi:hypothetical protein